MQKLFKYVAPLLVILLAACSPKIKLFSDMSDPLMELTISGTGKEKVLVIPISGIISDRVKRGLIEKPSLVQEVVSHLRLAENDPQVKAVVFKINSPGGSATASDIIYHETMAFKKRSGVKVVAALMNLATSGGYYISLPAEYIMAHPTTVTGSVGVVMLMPKLDGLMAKIGVDVDVQKSGEYKDMASPFRPATRAEKKIFEELTDALGSRFVRLVNDHRRLNPDQMANVSSARIFIARDALAAGLIDGIGYLNDALAKARELSGLSPDARVVVYRRTRYANDNLYNTATMQTGHLDLSLVNYNLPDNLSFLDAGFFYLWLPVAGSF